MTVSLAVCATSPADLAREAEERVRFETLLSDLSARFTRAKPESVDAEVSRALEEVRRFFVVDRCALVSVSADGQQLRNTQHASAPGLTDLRLGVDLSPMFPWVTSRVHEREVVRIRSVDVLPPDAAAERQAMAALGLCSLLVIPVIVSESVPHLIVMSTQADEHDWPEPYVSRLLLFGEILVGALERARSDRELQRTLAEVERLRDQLHRENIYLREEVASFTGGSIVGESRALRQALALADKVAATGATVLILGETGTGKELFARAIHERSPRHDRAMVRVNCGAMPATLIESELFGRDKGAFTGAVAKQVGRFELASGSTIFLDEVGELPAETQVKLLHVLQEKEIERLGSPRPIKVDVRVIAATNRDLAAAVREGRFREDLYYRLNVFPITVPPLRARPDDIPLLVWAFVDDLSRAMGKAVDSIPQVDLDALCAYEWPGNVRQLRNVVERAMILATSTKLRIPVPEEAVASVASPSRRLTDIERSHLIEVLTQAGWRVRGTGGAAEMLGMKPSTLESRMLKLGIKRPSRAR